MSQRIVSEWETLDNRGKAVVKYSDIDEMFFIEYFDDANRMFFTEDFPDKSLRYVDDAAENWVLGYRQLELEE